MSQNDYSEYNLIEKPAIQIFEQLGWKTACFRGESKTHSLKERKKNSEVFLIHRLRAKLQQFNPDLPDAAYDKAIDEITRDRSRMVPINANEEFYKLLKDGIKISFQDTQGRQHEKMLTIIDWNQADNNDFFLASQMPIKGEIQTNYPDLIGFVNGIPLLLIELKAIHRTLEHAYNDNLRQYKRTIPNIFIPNALIILSNGRETRLGTISATWEYFFEWKKIADETEIGEISLETVLKGVCEPVRFLDIVENFIIYQIETRAEKPKGRAKTGQTFVKKIARNHQYLGVNRAIQAVQNRQQNQGKLGVFWHTQGSGKSLSMIFFAQKVLRKLMGNWTFLIVTDRHDLDQQIYQNFVDAGAITKEIHTQAKDSQDLRRLLQQNNRYIFTLIQKFRTADGEEHYPKVSDRDDIIVITDEAHRSQYDILALNMRNALPNAAFIGFTGTPLIRGEEERTREVFGEYVSIYNFNQSIADQSTVPLYYENRLPQLQVIKDDDNFNQEMQEILDAAEIDPEQEKLLEQKFAHTYAAITREPRLEKVAEDVVTHFLARGYQGKAMMVCLDKATAIKMYDKVQKYWKIRLDQLEKQLNTVDAEQRAYLESQIETMKTMDMAVIVSPAQNEVEDLQKKGVDVTRHRQRMDTEKLDRRFKDTEDNLRFVFVCAMWITGFDVPSCSTMYLDKPMRNHTLMQTIARANRVMPGKNAGLIVDYIGVLKSLEQALNIYALPASDKLEGVDRPIADKQELVAELKALLTVIREFCAERAIDIEAIQQVQPLEKGRLISQAIDTLLKNYQDNQYFKRQTREIVKLFKAILPDRSANEMVTDVSVLTELLKCLCQYDSKTDASMWMPKVEQLLDNSISVKDYFIDTTTESINLADLVNSERITQFKESPYKYREAGTLRGAIEQNLDRLLKTNPSRINYYERFQQLIDEYNEGRQSIESYFDHLIAFVQDLSVEEQRHIREGLTEEELTLFDLLTCPILQLTEDQKMRVKTAARELLEVLKTEKASALDWHKKQQVQASIRVKIGQILKTHFPPNCTPEVLSKKSEKVYQHFLKIHEDGQQACGV